MNQAPPQRDVLLLGGGHAHALALRQLVMKAPAGVRLTLVSDTSHSPYSGMLPGLIAGHYNFADTHIDLVSFCARFGIRFIQERVSGIDTGTQQVILEGRPRLAYDVLSLNIGAQPDIANTEGAATFATPVKPVAGLYQRWLALEQTLRKDARPQSHRIVLVGGGAGSVELALAMRHRLATDNIHIHLVCGAGLLEGYNRGAKQAVRKILREQNIELNEQARVIRVEAASLVTEAGEQIAYDSLLWSTSAVATSWLREAGLPCDANGFLQITDTLQLAGHENIFAAGDIAVQTRHPRPRAGVFAVRQAPVLAHNLLAFLSGRPLREHRPQQRFLSLLSLGSKHAVAECGLLWVGGAWVWRWKDRIDRNFMALFREVPASMSAATMPALASTEDMAMHCGGCGAKLPAGMLRPVLADLATQFPDIVAAAGFSDDAAVLEVNPDQQMIQSVDSLRQLIDDPWIMGRIAALHALSDIHAMGASAHSCLAQITMPYGSAVIQQRDLSLLMQGAMLEMQAAGCRLLGGHSLEGAELSIGFTVNGEIESGQLLSKTTAQAGNHLILTKPLGTGVLFAALPQGGTDGRYISTAVASMLQSNAQAALIARQYGALACTDVTGFGLLGHLLEMLGTQSLQAVVSAQAVPLLPGAEEAFSKGFASTLEPGNRQAVIADMALDPACSVSACQGLLDPQTSGGLLIACEPGQVEHMLQALHAAGYSSAADIGKLRVLASGAKKLKLIV